MNAERMHRLMAELRPHLSHTLDCPRRWPDQIVCTCRFLDLLDRFDDLWADLGNQISSSEGGHGAQGDPATVDPWAHETPAFRFAAPLSHAGERGAVPGVAPPAPGTATTPGCVW